MAAPELMIVGGANGSGKTTFALKYAALLQCPYIGADAIAKQISPDHPERAAIAAGKEFILRLDEAIKAKRTVVVESTLSGRSLREAVSEARGEGFSVSMTYLFLDSADICVRRVAERVQKGGHFVPDEDIRRRFSRSLVNFWHIYRPLADSWALLYNSGEEVVDVASGSLTATVVREQELFSLFQRLVTHARS